MSPQVCMCQKRPMHVSKETYACVKRDLRRGDNESAGRRETRDHGVRHEIHHEPQNWRAHGEDNAGHESY